MKKHEFLKALEKRLRKFDPQERAEIVSDYADYFTAKEGNGLSEEEICRVLISPKSVAAEYSFRREYEKTELKPKLLGVLRMIVYALRAGALSALVAAPGFLSLILTMVVFYATAFGLIVGGLAGIASTFRALPFVTQLLDFIRMGGPANVFLGLACIAIGLIFAVLAGGIAKRALPAMARWIARMVRRNKKEEDAE